MPPWNFLFICNMYYLNSVLLNLKMQIDMNHVGVPLGNVIRQLGVLWTWIARGVRGSFPQSHDRKLLKY